MCGFATSLITVSFGMMNFRGVTDQTINVGNLCFVACIGLLVSAQWEMVCRNTFSYTVLSAYGTSDFYGGYGVLMLPTLNIAQPNVVYVLIFKMLELCLLIDGSSFFILAKGNPVKFSQIQQVAGDFGFVAGLLGFYTCAHYMCEEALPFRLPMGQLRKRGRKHT
ncbi:hypothetical protein F5X68DRAFT_268024 [Plectosphaerella plurivora]|uniref:Uncharacterized protein n=1 Tax=Plectosphaerella plurivora TaxID=936078 RepID=A0A9P8VFW2_9PEZI|nr:hypothetical protein F5X68DRAFT_268024 [Plectosphaerella plurivora]